MNDKNPQGGDSLENVAFDADRAAGLRGTIVDGFLAKARKLERRLYLWLVFFLVLACAMIRNFFGTAETQAQILWAVLFLVMFESTILIKLWYWIVNTRLGTQRELRLLRFDLAASKELPSGLDDLAQLESPLRPAGLPKWERWAWTAVLILGAYFTLGYRGCQGPGKGFENVITLGADGSGQEVTHWTYANRGGSMLMLREVPLYGGMRVAETEFIPSGESPYRDSMGRALAVRREPAGENRRDVIQLIDPVPFGHDAQIHWTTKVQAAREGGAWVYKIGPGNSYSTTIELPPGAELVSVTPPENSRRMEGDRLALRFEVATSPDKLVSYQIKYRLPPAASTSSAPAK